MNNGKGIAGDADTGGKYDCEEEEVEAVRFGRGVADVMRARGGAKDEAPAREVVVEIKVEIAQVFGEEKTVDAEGEEDALPARLGGEPLEFCTVVCHS